jgi:hypothetical protein
MYPALTTLHYSTVLAGHYQEKRSGMLATLGVLSRKNRDVVVSLLSSIFTGTGRLYFILKLTMDNL